MTAERLADREVLLVGGPAALAAEVEVAASEVAASVERLAGADRYATNAAVMAEALDRGVAPVVVHVATGAGWPDSLLAGAVTGRAGGLMALVDPAGLGRSTGVAATLAGVSDQVESLRVVGGPTALGEEVLAELGGLVP